MTEKKCTKEQFITNLDKRLKMHLETTIGVSLQHYAQGDNCRAFCTFEQAQGIARIMYFETDHKTQIGEYIDKKAKYYNVSSADYMNAMLVIKNNI